MTDFSPNLKGSGMMDERLSENVHHEMGNNQMGLELWRTEQAAQCLCLGRTGGGVGGARRSSQQPLKRSLTSKALTRDRGEKRRPS